MNNHDNLILIKNTLDKIRVNFSKKYREYMYCKYRNGVTLEHMQEYANDYLIINYYVIINEIDNLIKINDSIDNIIDNFYFVGENFNMIMKGFNDVIDDEIINIKKKNIFDTHDWVVMASHKHDNNYDYKHVKYKNLKTKVDIICYIHGMFTQRPDLHLINIGCVKCNLDLRIKNIPLENSFSPNKKSKYWSSKNILKPNEVYNQCNEKFIFDCDKCNHEFSIRLSGIQNGNWCSYCSNQKLCKDDNCNDCFSKSFASSLSPKLLQWSNKNTLTPRNIFKSSNTKYIFNCDKCNHEINMSLWNVCGGVWCYFCNNKQLCDSDSCKMCYEKTFAGSGNNFVKYWSKKNIILPQMVFKSSAKKYIFDCPFCNNEYISSLSLITQGHWCPCTFNKTETKLYEYLKIKYNDVVIEKQKKFDFCKNITFLPFDFCIEQYKVIIELDGGQHFKDVKYFRSTPEETQKNDKYKMTQAKNNGYSIIRIFQGDVWLNRNNWKENLHNAIMEISKNIGNPIIIYIGKLYETHYFILD